jgi:YedE family putative selenium metabolism protein
VREPLFRTGVGVVIGATLIGVVAGGLELLGNPPNMGICVVCFERDLVGALGLHRAAAVQYLRPEVPALALGGFLAALVTGSFRSRGGSAPMIRFLLGMFASVGALVFLGCTWRLGLRLAGLDGTALAGLLGFLAGIGAVAWFERRGFDLGPAKPGAALSGLTFPVLMGLLLVAAIAQPVFGKTGVLFASAKGPGALHASLAVSIVGGLLIGVLAQRTGFCTVGWIKRALLGGERRLLFGALAFLVVAFVVKAIGGKLWPGFSGAPIVHSDHLWNFLGMLLAGLAFALAGGCPGRQLVAGGEGNGDAGVFVSGSLVGAALAHNLALAAAPDKGEAVGGPGPWGQGAVILGIALCVAAGLLVRRPRTQASD